MTTCTEIVIAGINSTSGASDTDRLVVTDADGLIDPSFLTERVQDIVGAFVTTSTSITWTYSDAGGTLTGVITDRDYGDITVSATGATWTIDNSAVTYAKIQNVSATDKILGRATAGAGVVEEIACTAAGRALLDDADASAQRTTLGLGTMATESAGDYPTKAGIEIITGAWVFGGGAGIEFEDVVSFQSNVSVDGTLSITEGAIVSGTYTPTLTNVTNVSSSTAYECQYMRVGNVVTVSGQVDITATAAANTELGISLPVASNFAAVAQLGGVAASFSSGGSEARINADTTNDRAQLRYTASTTAARGWAFQFTYLIVA